MKKAGRGQGGALLRGAAKKNQTFSMKRLMRDYEEIEKNNLPTVGVTAKPLDHDMYLWHANLKGPEGTLYQGGVFHIEMKIPTSYPHHPPQIRLLTNLSHPNIIGNYICLDMLSLNRGEEGNGWSSAYSIQSVLMQLQSFLFEQDLSLTKTQKQIAIKKAVKQANEYKCTTRNCKHGGKLSCYPPFNVKENDLKEFVTLDDENDLIEKELVCYHTKHTYQQKQLGLGLKISKLPRTGGIRQAEAMFDYISIKAFLKESINWSSQNQKFTHWLPLYFGKKDNPEKFYKFLTHALSMIITNSTENFKPQYILEVLPKIMVTLIFYIMDQKKHPSIRIIRILTHIHAMFLFLVQKHPEIEAQIVQTIEKFIASDQNRIKDVVPNLAVILMIASVTDKFKFSNIAQAYFEQLMDRQILWILSSIPELGAEENGAIDEQKTALAYKSKITSFQMMCFNKLFLTEICEGHKSRKHLLEHYQENFCKLRNDEETELQKKIMYILKNVNDFNTFFEYVGLPKKTPQELTQILEKAIKNSERKRYHGQFDKINKMAPTQDQIIKYNERFETYTKFFDVKSLKIDHKTKTQSNQYKVEINEKQSTQEDWKSLCLNRWTWIKEQISNNPSLTSSDLSKIATRDLKNKNAKTTDRIVTLIEDKYRNSYINYNIPEVKLPQVSWKMLYLRLDLQQFLSLIDMNPNFNEFYNKLQVCKLIKLNTLIIPLVSVSNIKSGFYYLTSILSKLDTLEYIQICGNIGVNFEPKAARSLKKGFNNFKESKGNCRFFSCSNFYLQTQLADCLYGHLAEMKNIESISFKNNNLLEYNLGCKVFCHYLTELTKIKELKLNECTNLKDGKLVADALMRMKSLEILEYQQNPARSGLPAIIYNLSFSPHFKYLNFSNTYVDVNETKEIIASLEKLLKISGSIEVISASRIAALNNNLNKDFWITVGECRSIRVIDISKSGILDNTNVANMGTAIAFNAKKKGNLEYVNLSGCISAEAQISTLYNSMKISEYDEESWYGDPGKVAKMLANNYPKKFYNHLKALQLQENVNLNPSFSLVYYNKHTTKKTPDWVSLLRESSQLETLDLSSTQQQKNLAEILYLALDQRLPNLESKIKVLNLSKNRLGKDGAKLLAEVIEHNHFLEVLDISKNHIGVSGAQALSVSLKNNKSVKFINLFNNKITFDGAKAFAENVLPFNTVLEFLQIGHNRIRDKGLKAITNGITKNPQSNIKSLGLRFNFLTKTGIEFLLQQLSEHKNKVENVFVRNNLLDEFGIFFLNKISTAKNLNVYVDVFEKLKYLDSERMQRSIWVHPIGSNNRQEFKKFFEVTHPCGIVLDVRIRTGKKYPNKSGPNSFAVVQFADPSSVKHALYTASQRWANINGVPFRIYKAGTGTFFYMKKTSKQKSIENAKMLLPPLPFDTADYGAKLAQARRGGERRREDRGGRGRGGGRQPRQPRG